MVDNFQQNTTSIVAAKPLTSAPSAAVKAAAPAAANSSSLAPKKLAAKKKKSVKKTAAKKIAPKVVKLATATGTKAFDSMFKSNEAFMTFKPNTQTMEKLMTQSKHQMEKMTQDATSFSRESVEACIKSSNLWIKGCEDLMRTAMSLAQSAAEKQGKYVKEALSSKTLNEWAEVQSKIAQSNFDDFMSGATKMSEQYVKVLSTCTEPVNAQASKAVKKVTETLAA